MGAPVQGVIKKAAAAAATTATSLAWKRLSWQARAALMGGSFALGTARKLNSIRHRLAGSSKKGRRGVATAAGAVEREQGAVPTAGLSPAAAAFLAQRQAGNPVWAPAVRQALGRAP